MSVMSLKEVSRRKIECLTCTAHVHILWFIQILPIEITVNDRVKGILSLQCQSCALKSIVLEVRNELPLVDPI